MVDNLKIISKNLRSIFSKYPKNPSAYCNCIPYVKHSKDLLGLLEDPRDIDPRILQMGFLTWCFYYSYEPCFLMQGPKLIELEKLKKISPMYNKTRISSDSGLHSAIGVSLLK